MPCALHAPCVPPCLGIIIWRPPRRGAHASKQHGVGVARANACMWPCAHDPGPALPLTFWRLPPVQRSNRCATRHTATSPRPCVASHAIWQGQLPSPQTTTMAHTHPLPHHLDASWILHLLPPGAGPRARSDASVLLVRAGADADHAALPCPALATGTGSGPPGRRHHRQPLPGGASWGHPLSLGSGPGDAFPGASTGTGTAPQCNGLRWEGGAYLVWGFFWGGGASLACPGLRCLDGAVRPG